MDQFVVLHLKMPNDGERDDHWDLMLQHKAVLWTWALDKLPEQGSNCSGKKLPDHDIKYLEYEGPISGDRGHVTRVLSGRFKWLNLNVDGISTAEMSIDDQTWKMTVQSISNQTCNFEFQ